MSFGAVLKTIGKDVLKGLGVAAAVETTLGPILQVVLPAPISAIAKIIDNAVMTAEATITTAQAGVAKKESVTQIIVDEIPNVEAIISTYGPNITYDKAKLSAAIDSVVAAKNAVTDLVNTIHKS